MLYTIYRVTNTVNGKFYVGKHQTKDPYDDYMGSGKRLKQAILKYGQNAFFKEVLEVYETEREMNLAEKILVVVDHEVSYNLCPGGKGGWGYLNDSSVEHRNRATIAAFSVINKRNNPDKARRSLKAKRDAGWRQTNFKSFAGKKHSEETIEKMRASHRARANNPKAHPRGKRGPYKKRKLD